MNIAYPEINITNGECLYILLDGAKIDNLAQKIYTINNDVQGAPLYVTTPLAKVLEVSPWLLQISPEQLPHYLAMDEGSAKNALLIFAATTSLEEMLNFWRSRLYVRLPYEQESIFRLYDPAIFTALVEPLSARDAYQFMGASRYFWCWDKDKETWHKIENNHNLSEPLVAQITLSQQNFEQLTKLKKATFTQKLYQHIQQFFPETIHNKDQGLTLAKELINKSSSLGFTSQQSIFYFTSIWLTLGDACLNKQHYPEIATLLTTISEKTPTQRIELASQKLSDVI